MDAHLDMEALWDAVNFGTSMDNLGDIDMALIAYIQFMRMEEDNGKPHGETAWWAMERMVNDLKTKRDHLIAQMEAPGYLWVENLK